MSGISNLAYTSDAVQVESELEENNEKVKEVRDVWDNDIEFLFSCIALSVGLGMKNKILEALIFRLDLVVT